ncbi:MAG: 50S ribosomal protein L32 [Desulfuromonas sp. SDB]|nr:MAG: 50S ribosomal protein L32 [Desulfuromonas sp. SDB]
MALPKKRSSSTRGKKRRAHWKGSIPKLIKCPNCGNLTMPHSICLECGYYKDKPVIIEEEAE